MKILYLVTKSTYGGVQTHVRQCAEYMRSRGHTVAVMAHPADNDSGLEGELRELGIPFFPNTYFKNAYNPFLGFQAMREIKKIIRNFKPDIVSCHSSAAGFWGRLAIKNQVPTIFTAHGWGFSPGIGWFRTAVVKTAEKIAAPLCTKIICVSDYDRNLAITQHIASVDKLITIHNGVEDSITELPFQTEKIPELKGKIPVIFVGRFSAGKNPEQLLEAFMLLPQDIQDRVEVYMFGDGPKKGLLEGIINTNKLSGKVYLLGQLPRKELLSFLSTCVDRAGSKGGIFTLISQYEGLPRSILEAMACGLAVVATDVGGVNEEVTGDTGILVSRNDVDGLKKALELLLSDMEKTGRFGQAAQKRVREKFSLREMLTRTEEVYASVLGVGPSA